MRSTSARSSEMLACVRAWLRGRNIWSFACPSFDGNQLITFCFRCQVETNVCCVHNLPFILLSETAKLSVAAHQRRMVSSHVAMLQRFVRAPGQRCPLDASVPRRRGRLCTRSATLARSDRRHGHVRRSQLEPSKARAACATVRGWVGFGIHTARSRYPLPMGVLETVSRTPTPP